MTENLLSRMNRRPVVYNMELKYFSVVSIFWSLSLFHSHDPSSISPYYNETSFVLLPFFPAHIILLLCTTSIVSQCNIFFDFRHILYSSYLLLRALYCYCALFNEKKSVMFTFMAFITFSPNEYNNSRNNRQDSMGKYAVRPKKTWNILQNTRVIRKSHRR